MESCDECGNPAEMCLCEAFKTRDKRIAQLEAILRDARGALWELHDWTGRFEFNEDPTVDRINAALGDVLQKSQSL